MHIEKKKVEAKIFKKNDFLVVKDLTSKDNFTICLAKESVTSKASKATVVFLIRDKDKKQNFFVPLKEQSIKVQDILFSTNDVVVTETKEREKDLIKRKDLEISISRTKYNEIKKRVDKAIKEEGEAEESEEAEEEEDDQPKKKVKREKLIEKIAKPNLKDLAKAKKKRGVAEESEESEGSEEEPKEAQIPDKKVKVAPGKAALKEPKPKPLGPPYKKGQYNRNVEMMAGSEQYEGKSPEPNFECCVECNSKEFVRVAQANNPQLLKNLRKTRDQLRSPCVPKGPKSFAYPLIIALKNGNYDLFYKLMEVETDDKMFTNARKNWQFEFQSTGENDKYAYGVKTRNVEMARANREGTNAFLYDNNQYKLSLGCPDVLKMLNKHLTDEGVYMKLVGLNENFAHTLDYNFYQAVEFGNVNLAKWLSKKFVENGGFGFNSFHFLALSAANEDELNDMGKANCRKKANGNRHVTPTHLACLNPNPNILRRFLDIGQELYITDEFLRKPVHYAAMSPTIGALEVLLERGIDCRDYDKNKWTPLMFAAQANRPENIRLMCNHVNYNINLKNKEGNAAIHIAAMYGNFEALRELIALGADKNLPGKNRCTPVIIAAEFDHFEIVQFLVESGARTISSDKFKKTALIHAVISGNIKTASFLLSKGAEFNHKDSSENTPLHFACAYGHYEMIDLLIKAGANINAVNSWNLQPILVALMKNHYRCLKLLVNYPNIDVNCQDKNGSSLIMNCFSQFTEISYQFCEFLIKQKAANVNLGDFSGNLVFHKMAMFKPVLKNTFESYKEAKADKQKSNELFRKFFNLFCESGVEKNQRNLKGYSAFEIAVNEENWMFVEGSLKDKQITVTSTNDKNETILFKGAHFFFNKKGLDMLNHILGEFGSLQRLETQVDHRGFNFYHSIVSKFLKLVQSNPYGTIYNQKVQIRNDYLRKSEQTNNAEESALLYNKLKSAESKKNFKLQQSIKMFEDFNQLLYQKSFNFFVRVQEVRTPYDVYMEKKGERGTANRPMKRRPNYNSVYYNPGYNKTNNQEDNNEKSSKIIDLVINDHAGCTLFHLLMVYPVLSILDQLYQFAIEAGDYLPNERNLFQETLFNYYTDLGSNVPSIPKLLMSYGENPNLDDGNSNFPFIKVCQGGKIQVVEEMIGLSINLNVQDKNGETPLIYFAKKRSMYEVQMLIASGANLQVTDQNGRNALHWVINNNTEADTNFEFEEMLIANHININQVDARGRQPVHYFFTKIGDPFINAKKDPIEIFADFLGNKDLELTKPDVFGNTPLCYAAQRGANLCFGALIKRGANINHRNNVGNCPLTIALMNNHIDIAVFCLQNNVGFKVDVFEVNTQALLKWNQLSLKYDRLAEEIQEKAGLPPLPSMVREKEIASYIAAKTEEKKLLEQFSEEVHETSNVQSLQTKVKTMSADQLSVPHLKMLARDNFVVRVFSVFKAAIQKSADAVNYLLIDSGLNLGIAIMDTLEANLFKYTIKLLSKRVDENNPNFLQQFETVNGKKQNLAHAFAIHSRNMTEDVAIQILNLMCQKNINLEALDAKRAAPILYLAFENKNICLLDALLQKKVAINTSDENNNNLVSCFIQNHPNLKKLAKDSDLLQMANSFGAKKSKRAMMGGKYPRKTLAAPYIPLVHTNTTFNNSFVNPARDLSFGNSFVNQTQNYSFGNSFGSQAQPMPFANQSFGGFQNNPFGGFGQSTNIAMPAKSSFGFGKPNFGIMPETGYNFGESMLRDDEAKALDWIKRITGMAPQFLNSQFLLFSEAGGAKKNLKRYTLLSYAIKKLSNLTLARTLIELGANINVPNDKGHTILTWAIRRNNANVVNFLLEFSEKINFELTDAEGRTYIHHIVNPMKNASYENTSFLELFAAKNPNVLNQPDRNGNPPIYYASQQESGKMTKQLLTLGARELKNQQRVQKPVSILENVDFFENKFDFEEDHQLAVERAQQQCKKGHFEIEEKPKPNPLVQGRVRLVEAENGEYYEVKLVKVEVKYGYYSENVFYVMQICYDELRRIHILFTNWGRIGTEGQNQQTPFFQLADCLKEFKKIFKEKTGNEYDNKANFAKMVNKYRLIISKPKLHHKYIVELVDPENARTVRPTISPDLCQLMDSLTNSKLTQVVYSNFGLDKNSMPFGNLSRQHIQDAKAVLLDIQQLTDNLENNRKKLSPREIFEIANEISEKTSTYLEIMPTVGNRTEYIPVFNAGKVANEFNKLYDLENLEVISRILGAASFRVAQIHPFDYCIQSLNIKMVLLDPQSEEYALINKYQKSGSASSGRQIGNVWAVERKGEYETFNHLSQIGNKRLLWHGTRTENLMGILHQGLRVAPITAQRTGARLGSGIYFSDSFQNSARFSSEFSSRGGSQTGYILLGEVALGKMERAYNSANRKPLQKEFYSVKGQGRETPDKNQRVYLSNGCMIPLGRPVTKYDKPPEDKGTYFEFQQNEYVVFNKGQVRLRYLVELKNNGGEGYEEDDL